MSVRRLIPLLLAMCAAASPVSSEAIFDGTLGPNPDGTTRSGQFTIAETDGVVDGQNLFHSFRVFNVLSNESASFTTNTPIQNIIARVTGNALNGNTGSTIAGPLDIAPGASLHLLNPMGILFAPGAQVDISGSVFLTTADSLRFDEAGGPVYFGVSDPTPSLSMAPPAAFAFRPGADGRITFSSGSTSRFENFDFGRNASVHLISSDVDLEQATVETEAGLIRVAAVGAGGVEVPIEVESWSPDDTAGDVRLTNLSSFCADSFFCQGGSAALADRGRIVVRAGRLILDESQLIAGGDGAATLAIDVETSGDITLTGLNAFVTAFGTGPNAVGGIRLVGDRIEASNSILGVLLESGTGTAPLELTANQIVLEDAPVESFAQGAGDGADIVIDTDLLMLTDAARIRTISEANATGDAGSIRVNVGEVTLAGGSLIGSSTAGAGAAGRILDGRRLGVGITAERLALTGGSQITTTTDAAGDAGNLELSLSGDLLVSGTAAGGGVSPPPSGLFARSGLAPGSPATGQGGVLDISARAAEIVDGAEISVVTFGSADAGSMTLDIDETLRVDGIGTSINARGQEGAGGDIGIAARDITVSGGGEIAAEALLGGDAGSITLDAEDSLDVDGGSISTRLRQLGSNAAGGDILLAAGSTIRVGNGGVVSSQGASTARAGDIRISTPGLVQLERGGLVSAAATGSGDAGGIEINAGVFRADRASVTTESAASAGGAIEITRSRSIELQDASIETSVELSGDGSGGNVTLTGERVVINSSPVLAQAIEGPGGNILIAADGLLISADSEINASSRSNVDGQILIRSPDSNLVDRLAALPDEIIQTSTQLASRCTARDPDQRSSLIVGERDATPASPDLWLAPPITSVATSDASVSALSADARAAVRRGDWATAADMLDRIGAAAPDTPTQIQSLLAAADALEALGARREAERRRRAALAGAESLGLDSLAASARADLAALRVPGAPSPAQIETLEAAAIALEGNTAPAERARVLHRIGNAQWLAGRPAKSRASFNRAAAEAKAAGLFLSEGRAHAVAARVALEQADIGTAVAQLEAAAAALHQAPTSSMLAATRLHLGETWRRLADRVPTAPSLAYMQLLAARDEAEAAGDARAASGAYRGLSRLYEDEARLDEALELARAASRSAQRANAGELLYRSEWQLARLLAAKDDIESAIEAYDRSLAWLESLRFETPPPHLRYREDVAAVYYGLVALLLNADVEQETDDDVNARLRRAREIIEQSKASELRDYFRDPCVDALAERSREIDDVSSDALIVYPVPLEDRLELLVTLPGGTMKRLTVPVEQKALEQEVRRFRTLLEDRTTRQYLRPAQSLYDFLARPLDPLLAETGVETLVFVPDGSLRTIPMGALHDGEKFLVQKIALAVTPSISLTDPRSVPVDDLRPLLGGLSIGRDGFSDLDYASREIEALHEILGGDVLMNADFTQPTIETHVRENEYNLMHFATHAEFGRDGDSSFLLTFDGRLTIDRLEALVNRFRFREEPLELLGLSACETAAGDDRAALGLSGMAVRAGARSVLGTLWATNDEAASDLVRRFYSELLQPGVTRAEALRRAQIALIDRTAHPFEWAPFILINSWL